MAMVTGALVWPAASGSTSTASPTGASAGTLAFTSYSPAKPGVRPLNSTSAGFPSAPSGSELGCRAGSRLKPVR